MLSCRCSYLAGSMWVFRMAAVVQSFIRPAVDATMTPIVPLEDFELFLCLSVLFENLFMCVL